LSREPTERDTQSGSTSCASCGSSTDVSDWTYDKKLLKALDHVRLRRLEGTAFWDPNVEPGSVTELRVTDHGFEFPTVLEDLFRAAERKAGGARA
jgi:hypothetical protein